MEGDNFRRDPLYRIMELPNQIKQVEGKFKPLFDRLKKINNLGLIPEVFEMGRYPKYEHTLGTIHQVDKLLEVVDDKTIKKKYEIPLIISSLFLHLGHLPYTYSTERALIMASHMGKQGEEIKKKIEEKVRLVLKKAGYENKEEKAKILEEIFTLKKGDEYYKYRSAYILIQRWEEIKNRIDRLQDDDLKIIIKNLIDPSNEGYELLNLANQADYVLRDGLYLGTIKLDILPEHLYKELPKQNPEFSVNEKKLIQYNYEFLDDRFYNNPEVRYFSRLYEKTVSALLISSSFDLGWLENPEIGDKEFERIICEGNVKNSDNANLSDNWTKRAEDLLKQKIDYSRVFKVEGVFLDQNKSIFDLEYDLLNKRKGKVGWGLLRYPFKRGVLLDIDYLQSKDLFSLPYSTYKPFSVSVFQDQSNKDLSAIIKILKNLRKHLSILNHIPNIKEELAKEFSWTGEAIIKNEALIKAIIDAIIEVEEDEYDRKGEFVEEFIKFLSDKDSYKTLWRHPENNFLWRDRLSKKFDPKEDKGNYYRNFVKGLLNLPPKLLQFKNERRLLGLISDKLLQKIEANPKGDDSGDYFDLNSAILT